MTTNTNATTITKEQVTSLIDTLRQSGDCTVIQLARYSRLERGLVETILAEALKQRLVRQLDKKHWRANPPPPTAEERRAEAERYLRRDLERTVQAAQEARADLMSKMTKTKTDATALDNQWRQAYEAEYAIRWAESFYSAQYSAQLALKVLIDNDHWAEEYRGDAGFIARAKVIRDELRDELLRNGFRPTSSSMFSNACEIAKAECTRRMLETLERGVRWHDTKDEEAV